MPLNVALANDAKVSAVANDGKTANGTTDADADEPCILKFPSGVVKCRERLGGLLRHYYREAA